MIEEAVADARENAALNNIEHADFFAGDVIDVCNDAFFAAHGRPDVIITDPPRAGMHEKLVKKILDIAAPTVVYVSCNPATQARDLQLLDEKYAVTQSTAGRHVSANASYRKCGTVEAEGVRGGEW